MYYNEKEGRSEEVSASETAGTTDKSKPIKGIKIRLDDSGARKFDILYRVHKFDGQWSPWAKNGEELYSQDLKLNSLQIKLEPKIYLKQTNAGQNVLNGVIRTLQSVENLLAFSFVKSFANINADNVHIQPLQSGYMEKSHPAHH